MSEAEAYTKMLTNENPFYSGMSKRSIYYMQESNRQVGFGALTPQNQQRALNGQWDCSIGGGCP